MSKVAPENIRNIALVGHNGTGKTTLTEALLFAGGAIKKKGTVADKNTVSDSESEEKERGHSIETSVTHIDFDGKHINLLDCPGLPDFMAGRRAGSGRHGDRDDRGQRGRRRGSDDAQTLGHGHGWQPRQGVC